MREAHITIKMGTFVVDALVQYVPDDEQKILMSLIRNRIKKELSGLKRLFFKSMSDKQVMAEIIKRENTYFDRDVRDPDPKNWEEFKVWGIEHQYLSIREV